MKKYNFIKKYEKSLQLAERNQEKHVFQSCGTNNTFTNVSSVVEF